MEREAVIRMDDPRHRGAAGGEAADGTRLRGVRMDHVKPALAEQGAECAQRPQITARVDGGAQRRLDDHLQASRGRLIKQVVAAAGDDRRLELIMIKCLGTAQREHACAALQPGDEGSYPQRPGGHRLAQPAEAAAASRDQ